MSRTIIYVGEFVLPDKGAAANRVVSNSKIFKELGYETIFLGAADSDDFFQGIRKVDGFENMYEEAHPSSSVQWAKHIFSTENIVKLVDAHEADFVVLYNLPVVTVLAVKLALKNKNTRIIYDCTEWTSFTSGSLPKKVFKFIDEWMVRNLLDKIVDNIIVISRMMEKKYSGCKNLIKLPPLVDTQEELWHQRQERSDGIFEFCFAGVPDGNKESLDKILCSFSEISDKKIRLRLIGVTKDECNKIYPELSEIIEDDRIVFMGKLSHKETLKFVSECDCYIFIRNPDRRNNAGFPTKFSEAYTLAMPIITSEISDISDYLKENQGVILDDISVDSVKKAMIDQITYNQKSNNSVIRTTFDYRTFTDKVKEFLL